MAESPRVVELYGIIAAAKKELGEIRKSCPHTEQYVGWYSWRIGSMEPMKLCSSCNDVTGRPEQAETNAFMRAEKDKQIEFLKKTYSEEEAKIYIAVVEKNDLWSREV